MPDEQKEIGMKLLEIHDKNTDKLFSLIQFGIVVLTLYAAVFIYKPQEIIDSLKTNNWNINFCIFSWILSIAFPILTMQISNNNNYSMFEKNNGFIQFKNENDFLEQNKLLFSQIDTQNNSFISSLLLIVCSIGFGYSYLLTNEPISQQVQKGVYYLFCVFLVVSILIRFKSETIDILIKFKNWIIAWLRR